MASPHEAAERPGFKKIEQLQTEKSLYPTVYTYLMDRSLTMAAQLVSGASRKELQYLFTNQFPPPEGNTQIEDPWGFFSGYMHIGLWYAQFSQATQDPNPLPLPPHSLQNIDPQLYRAYQQHAQITQEQPIAHDEGRFIHKSLSHDPTGEVFLLGQMQSEHPLPSQQWGMMYAIQDGVKEYAKANTPTKGPSRRLNVLPPPTP